MEKITVDINKFAPSISESHEATEIVELIKKSDPQNNIVNIEMSHIKAITTSCAKSIFGCLYLELGEDVYNTHVDISSATKAVKVVIKWGIKELLEESCSR